MRRTLAYLIVAFAFCCGRPATTNAQDMVVPAGTLLHCTLDEPNFSSATATVGDPVVCQLRGMDQFGHSVFPRGSYLAGHLEAEKEPGHFVGKGYLKLEFDRVCLPNSCVPVPGKVVAVRGYRVNREGDVVGHGHATRDTVEWMLPPLWPWKVLTLPARGPRPTLKGEVPITLRLMDDIEIPRMRASVQSPDRPPYAYRPQTFEAPASLDVWEQSYTSSANNLATVRYLAPSTPSMETEDGIATTLLAHPQAEESSAGARHQRLTWIALKSDTIFGVASYQIHDTRVNYVRASGLTGVVDVSQVDWRKTSQLNAGPDLAMKPRNP